MITIKEAFTEDKYLGKFFGYDNIYVNVRKEVSRIIHEDKKRVFVSGDVGSGKTTLALCVVAYNLLLLSFKTWEEFQKELDTKETNWTIYVDMLHIGRDWWRDTLNKIIDHIQEQDYNKFDWDRLKLVTDPTNFDPIIAIIDDTDKSSWLSDKKYLMRFRNLDKSPICKYIRIDDIYSDFYRTNLRLEDRYEKEEK